MNDRLSLTPDDLQSIADLFERLSALTKNFQIYGIDHPRTRELIEGYQALASRVRRTPGIGNELVIPFHDGRFYLEHVPLSVQRNQGLLLYSHLERNKKGGFVLTLEMNLNRLSEVLRVLAARPTRDGSDSELEADGFRWLDQGEVYSLESSSRRADQRVHMILELEDLTIQEDLYDSAMTSLCDFMENCREPGGDDLRHMNQITKNLVGQFLHSTDQEILPLTTIPYHDNFTYYHSLNVALLTLRAASLVTQSEAQLHRIGQAALLHDLGKVDVPLEILYKPGRLNDAESELVMRHPVTGAARLATFPDADPLTPQIAFSHHIKDNGKGYPKVSRNFKMSAVSRLLEVVDIFEALTAHRPYKKAMTATQAFEILYGIPNMESFRPYMDLLVRAIGFNPVGSRVRTADGELGVVIGHVNNDPRKPLIRAVEESSDERSLGAPREMESLLEGEESACTVVALDPEEDLCLA